MPDIQSCQFEMNLHKTMMKTFPKNKPIATVIKNYVDKKSGKVSVSRDEIQRRFFGLDWKFQKKILGAFLDASMSDREWAYSRLLDLWDDAFTSKVLELWEAYHEERCAWVIIRHFPTEFIKEHIDEFNNGRDYYFICRRLVAEADFMIDKDRLSKTDYLMALSHGNRLIDNNEANDVLFSIVRDICFHWCPSMEIVRNYHPVRNEVMAASDFTDVSMALYYLGKMGNENLVTAFHAWEDIVKVAVSTSDEYNILCNEPVSDYDYKERLAVLVQKNLYYSLPAKYKTMTDEEYDNLFSEGSPVNKNFYLMNQEALLEDWLLSLETNF